MDSPGRVSKIRRISSDPVRFEMPLDDPLLCNCLCDNCVEGNKCHYSSYHCKHAKECEKEYGVFESKGFCVKTGYMPSNSWRHSYSPWHTDPDKRLVPEVNI